VAHQAIFLCGGVLRFVNSVDLWGRLGAISSSQK
jgi:hypothetical protein